MSIDPYREDLRRYMRGNSDSRIYQWNKNQDEYAGHLPIAPSSYGAILDGLYANGGLSEADYLSMAMPYYMDYLAPYDPNAQNRQPDPTQGFKLFVVDSVQPGRDTGTLANVGESVEDLRSIPLRSDDQNIMNLMFGSGFVTDPNLDPELSNLLREGSGASDQAQNILPVPASTLWLRPENAEWGYLRDFLATNTGFTPEQLTQNGAPVLVTHTLGNKDKGEAPARILTARGKCVTYVEVQVLPEPFSKQPVAEVRKLYPETDLLPPGQDPYCWKITRTPEGTVIQQEFYDPVSGFKGVGDTFRLNQPEDLARLRQNPAYQFFTQNFVPEDAFMKIAKGWDNIVDVNPNVVPTDGSAPVLPA